MVFMLVAAHANFQQSDRSHLPLPTTVAAAVPCRRPLPSFFVWRAGSY